jgi:hypothetical protein
MIAQSTKNMYSGSLEEFWEEWWQTMDEILLDLSRLYVYIIHSWKFP